jgi:hypothetical protein
LILTTTHFLSFLSSFLDRYLVFDSYNESSDVFPNHHDDGTLGSSWYRGPSTPPPLNEKVDVAESSLTDLAPSMDLGGTMDHSIDSSTDGLRRTNDRFDIHRRSLGFCMGCNGLATKPTMEWNALFRPSRFSPAELGRYWIGENETQQIWDNRHIHEELKTMLCQNDEKDGATPFQTYFAALIELAWPEHAELWVCCSMPAGANATEACPEPDLQFDSQMEDGCAPPVFAPHFLTEQFERGQQEALTAALIAEINVLGKHLEMDFHGRFDLGLGKRGVVGVVGLVFDNRLLICRSCLAVSYCESQVEPGFLREKSKDSTIIWAMPGAMRFWIAMEKTKTICCAKPRKKTTVLLAAHRSSLESPCSRAPARATIRRANRARLVSVVTWRKMNGMAVAWSPRWDHVIVSAWEAFAVSMIHHWSLAVPPMSSMCI